MIEKVLHSLLFCNFITRIDCCFSLSDGHVGKRVSAMNHMLRCTFQKLRQPFEQLRIPGTQSQTGSEIRAPEKVLE